MHTITSLWYDSLKFPSQKLNQYNYSKLMFLWIICYVITDSPLMTLVSMVVKPLLSFTKIIPLPKTAQVNNPIYRPLQWRKTMAQLIVLAFPLMGPFQFFRINSYSIAQGWICWIIHFTKTVYSTFSSLQNSVFLLNPNQCGGGGNYLLPLKIIRNIKRAFFLKLIQVIKFVKSAGDKFSE